MCWAKFAFWKFLIFLPHLDMKTGKESQNVQKMQLSKDCLQLKAGLSLCENYKKQLLTGVEFYPFFLSKWGKKIEKLQKAYSNQQTKCTPPVYLLK